MRCVNVDILLATYNGARYLPEQLDSLLHQTEVLPRIIISDDGSSDETLSIIGRLEAMYPGRIKRLPQGPGRGASANFNYLLASTDAHYVFLADQDDVWDQDKVVISLDKMWALEQEHGTETPLLVHTDLRVMDESLQLISPSFFEFQNLKKSRDQFKDLLFQNTVTGCTVLANRALLNKALPIPSAAMMHDWWLALVAAAFGKIGFVDKATMSYRQHGSNTVGARGWTMAFILDRLGQLTSRRSAGALLSPLFFQITAFMANYRHAMASQRLKMLSDCVAMMGQSNFSRVFVALRDGFRKHGALRTAGLYWALLMADFDK